jgi:hypothetical protein
MDLQLALRVLWRFRVVVAGGFVLALLLTVLAVARVGFESGVPSISYRQSEQWDAGATILITHEGFALGRALYTDTDFVPLRRGDPESDVVPRYADPSRFAGYAALYARIATSDAVLKQMLRDGPVNGSVLVSGRKLTRPGFVFVAVMMMVIGLVFVLENLRPGVRLAVAEQPSPIDAATRRSATR